MTEVLCAISELDGFYALGPQVPHHVGWYFHPLAVGVNDRRA